MSCLSSLPLDSRTYSVPMPLRSFQSLFLHSQGLVGYSNLLCYVC